MPHRLRTPVEDPLAKRGVYLQPFLGPDGERYVVAVDRHGKRILEATLPRGGRDVDSVVHLLWEFLDTADPAAHLTLLS